MDTRPLPSGRSTRIVPSTLPVTFLTGRVLVPALFFLSLTTTLPAQVGGEGTSFTVVVPFTSWSNTASLEKIRLYFTSTSGAAVSVRYGEGGPGPIDFTVPPGGSWQVNLDTNDLTLPRAQGTFRRLLRVSSDNPVTVTVFIDRGTASEAYSAIPDSLCGFEYVGIAETSGISGSFVTVAALEDNTAVEITPTQETRNGDPAGVPFTVTLDRGEVYQLLSAPMTDLDDDDDLSGSRIVAERPVVVHGGATCVLSPVGNTVSCGPLLEQLPHVDALGTTHVFPLFREERSGFLRAVPVCGPVRLRAPGFSPPLNRIIEGDSGTTVGASLSGLVTSSTRVLLGHIGTNVSRNPPAGLDGPVGDPSLSILVPERQMVRTYRFVVPGITSRVDGGVSAQWLHFATVTRTDLTTTARLNGRSLTFVGHVADTLVDPGTFLLEADGPVSITVNGRSVSDAYSFVPGIVTQGMAVMADTVFGVACIDGFDTEVVLRNVTGGRIRIDKMEFLNGMIGRPIASFPVEIDAGDSLQFPVHFEGSTDSVTGRIVLYTGTDECAERVGVVHVRLNGMTMTLDPPRRSTLRFPDLRPPDTDRDTVITVTNTGEETIDIVDIQIDSDRFRLISPGTSFPLPPGASREVTVRFRPSPGDHLVGGKIRFLTEPCPDDSSWVIDLVGRVRYYDVYEPVELFDTVYCGRPDADTLAVIVANRESVSLLIDSIRILGGDPGEFVLDDLSPEPIGIGPGDSLSIRVIYTPGATGRRQALVRMWGPAVDFDPYEVSILVDAERYSFEFVPTSLAFGAVDCDTVVERGVLLRNNGTLPLRGFDVGLHRGVAFDLNRTGSDPPGPGEDLLFSVVPLGPPGLHRDTLHFTETICGTDILLPVSVLCTDSGSISVSLPELTAEIAEKIEIPVRIGREEVRFGAGIPFVLDLRLRFSADLFFPEGALIDLPDGVSAEVYSDEIEGRDRIFGIRYTGVFPSGRELGRLPGIVLLGDATSTALAVDTAIFRFDVPVSDHIRTSLTTVDGILNVTGYCEVGGTRFIRSTGEFGMKVAPSPASTEVTLLLDLVEDGEMAIDLWNSRGERVLRLYEGAPGSGRWAIPADLRSLSEGTYIVRLRTPTQVLDRRLVIRYD